MASGFATQAQEFQSLCEMFQGMQSDIIESVYTSLNKDFGQTLQALSDMQQSADTQVQLSPEKKLSFLKVVFDKLDSQYVAQVLQQFRWSVEAALDDLLKAEEVRSAKEQALMRKAEEERRRREEEQRLILRKQQQEIERNNAVIMLQSVFPRLEKQIIIKALNDHQWDTRVAASYLLPLEEQRIHREELEIQLREQKLKEAEEARRREEEARLRREAEALKEEQVQRMMHECRDWNDVYARFGYPQGNNNAEELARDQQLMVQVAKDLGYGNIGDAAINQIFHDSAWVLDKAFPELEKRSMDKFRAQLQEMFPTLSAAEIESTVQEVYPNFSEAIAQLRPISKKQQITGLYQGAAENCKIALEEAMLRQKKYDQEVDSILQQRAQRISQLQQLQAGERALMQTAHEILKQKEDLQIEENKKRHSEEVVRRYKEYEESQAKLKANPIKEAEIPVGVVSSRPKSFFRTAAERWNAFKKMLAEKRAGLARERQDAAKAKQTIIADRIRNSFGEKTLSDLQNAIERAPGGVDKGYTRKAYGDGTSVGFDLQKDQLHSAPHHPQEQQQPTAADFANLAAQLADANISLGSNRGDVGTPQNVPSGSQHSTPRQHPQFKPPQHSTPQPHAYPPQHSTPPPHAYPSQHSTPQLYPSQHSTPQLYPSQHSTPQYHPSQHATPQANPSQPLTPQPGLSLHAQELQAYNYYFTVADVNQRGFISMEDARFFRFSKLPDNVLAKIWAIASGGENKLTREQFYAALRMVALAQQGRPIDHWEYETNVPIPYFDQVPVPMQQPDFYQQPQPQQPQYSQFQTPSSSTTQPQQPQTQPNYPPPGWY